MTTEAEITEEIAAEDREKLQKEVDALKSEQDGWRQVAEHNIKQAEEWKAKADLLEKELKKADVMIKLQTDEIANLKKALAAS